MRRKYLLLLLLVIGIKDIDAQMIMDGIYYSNCLQSDMGGYGIKLNPGSKFEFMLMGHHGTETVTGKFGVFNDTVYLNYNPIATDTTSVMFDTIPITLITKRSRINTDKLPQKLFISGWYRLYVLSGDNSRVFCRNGNEMYLAK